MDMSTPLALYNHILRGEIIGKIILTTKYLKRKLIILFIYYISK